MGKQFMLFQINNFKMALDVQNVLFIMDDLKINKMPFYPKYVIGAVKYNDNYIPLIDLLKIINGEKSENKNLAMITLINNKEHAFLVSKVEDVVTKEENDKYLNINDDIYNIIKLNELKL